MQRISHLTVWLLLTNNHFLQRFDQCFKFCFKFYCLNCFTFFLVYLGILVSRSFLLLSGIAQVINGPSIFSLGKVHFVTTATISISVLFTEFVLFE